MNELVPSIEVNNEKSIIFYDFLINNIIFLDKIFICENSLLDNLLYSVYFNISVTNFRFVF